MTIGDQQLLLPGFPASYVIYYVSSVLAKALSGATGQVQFSGAHDAVHTSVLDTLDPLLGGPGGSLCTMTGIYQIGTRIIPRNQVKWFGEGRSTVLAATANLGANSIIKYIGADAGHPLTDSIIQYMTLDGTNMPAGYSTAKKGIDLRYTLRCVLDNLYVKNTIASGIGPDFNVEAIITNNVVENVGTVGQVTGSNGIGCGSGGYSDEPTIIANNHVIGAQDNGIIIEEQGSVGNWYIIDHNYTKACGNSGLAVNGGQNAIIANNIDNGSKHNLSLADNGAQQAKYVIVTGNRFMNATDDAVIMPKGASTDFIFSSNAIVGATGHGMNLQGSRVLVVSSIIRNNGKAGVIYSSATGADRQLLIIALNSIRNNSQSAGNTFDAIKLDSTTLAIKNFIVALNELTDDQGVSNTQRYGYVQVTGAGLTNGLVCYNIFDNNKTAAVLLSGGRDSTVKLRDNLGFLTEASGSASVAAAATTVVVTHGLGYTPSINDIIVIPQGAKNNATWWWVSNVTATQFTINVDIAPAGTALPFTWAVAMK